MKVEDIFKQALENKDWKVTGTGEGPVQGVIDLTQFDGCLTLHFKGREPLRLNPLQLSDLKFELVEAPKVPVPETKKPAKIEPEPKPKATKSK